MALCIYIYVYIEKSCLLVPAHTDLRAGTEMPQAQRDAQKPVCDQHKEKDGSKEVLAVLGRASIR